MDYTIQRRKKWLDKNSHRAKLLCNHILSLNPELGFYLIVDGIEISEDFFEEEYLQILAAYHSVLKKMNEHTKK